MAKVSAKSTELADKFLRETAGGNIDWSAPHYQGTARRFATMIAELTTDTEFKKTDFTTFPNALKNDEMVVETNIPFVALCAHHVVPFVGVAHIGYIPTDRIAGLSKFARAVKFWSRGLWTQEDLCDAIAVYLEDMLDPLGLGVILEAEHLCMTIRGIQSPGTRTVTSAMKGVFLDSTRQARSEFLTLVKGR